MSYYKNPGVAPDPFETFDTEQPIKLETNPAAKAKADAKAQHLDNMRRALADAVAAVNVASPERDASQNGRYRYERNWERLREAARQVFLESGKPVEVPVVYFPPPGAVQQQGTRFGAEAFSAAPLDNGEALRLKKLKAKPIARGLPGTLAEEGYLNAVGVPPVVQGPSETIEQANARRGAMNAKTLAGIEGSKK